MVSDDGTSNSNNLGADVDEKVGGLARIVGDIFSSDSAMTKSSKSNADFNPERNNGWSSTIITLIVFALLTITIAVSPLY